MHAWIDFRGQLIPWVLCEAKESKNTQNNNSFAKSKNEQYSEHKANLQICILGKQYQKGAAMWHTTAHVAGVGSTSG